MYDVKPLKSINYGVTGTDAILQNAGFLLGTIQGSCPMDRDCGWHPPIDEPTEYAMTTYAAKVIELLERNITGLTVESVSFEEEESTHKIFPHVKVVIDDGEI